MRLVLLPGLNGSSTLFTPLLAELGDIDCQVLELPEHGPQDYDALAQKIAERLHSTPFVLLANPFPVPLLIGSPCASRLDFRARSSQHRFWQHPMQPCLC